VIYLIKITVMKRFYYTGILLLSLFLAIFSCKPKDEPTKCCDVAFHFDTVRGTGGDSIIVYSAFTPNNYPFYDEIGDSTSGFYRGKPIAIYENDPKTTLDNDTTETGRPNTDSIYNDDINSYFHIVNIEKYPYNKIYFYNGDVKDTTPIMKEPYINYKNKKGTVFDGRSNEALLQPDGSSKTLPKYIKSGHYRCKIYLYQDERWTIGIDTLEFPFCIIRVPDYDFNENCSGVDSGDPVLSK